MTSPSAFVFEKALLREGLPTRSFTNPKRGADRAGGLAGGGDGPQVLVSDIRMPGGSGLDLLDARSKPACRGCRSSS